MLRVNVSGLRLNEVREIMSAAKGLCVAQLLDFPWWQKSGLYYT